MVKSEKNQEKTFVDVLVLFFVLFYLCFFFPWNDDDEIWIWFDCRNWVPIPRIFNWKIFLLHYNIENLNYLIQEYNSDLNDENHCKTNLIRSFHYFWKVEEFIFHLQSVKSCSVIEKIKLLRWEFQNRWLIIFSFAVFCSHFKFLIIFLFIEIF